MCILFSCFFPVFAYMIYMYIDIDRYILYFCFTPALYLIIAYNMFMIYLPLSLSLSRYISIHINLYINIYR